MKQVDECFFLNKYSFQLWTSLDIPPLDKQVTGFFYHTGIRNQKYDPELNLI